MSKELEEGEISLDFDETLLSDDDLMSDLKSAAKAVEEEMAGEITRVAAGMAMEDGHPDIAANILSSTSTSTSTCNTSQRIVIDLHPESLLPPSLQYLDKEKGPAQPPVSEPMKGWSVEVKEGKKHFQCLVSECKDLSFSNIFSFRRHWENIHSNFIKLFSCPIVPCRTESIREDI